jgi:hypothetical protein
MCSTPRSSSSCFSSRRRRDSQPADHQAYARMLREASANFERVQAMKLDRELAAQTLDAEANAEFDKYATT